MFNRLLYHCRGILSTWRRVAVEFNTQNCAASQATAPHQTICAAHGHHSSRLLTSPAVARSNFSRPEPLAQWPKRFVQSFRYLQNDSRGR